MTENFKPNTKYLAFRAQILRTIRRTLHQRDYIEVETPKRVRAAGTDVNVEVFSTEERYLITSPEFHMKRLLAAGMSKIYQICPSFRKDERTRLHNPEFTILECYAAGLTLEGMMSEIEDIVKEIARETGRSQVDYDGVTCDLTTVWKRLTVDDAFLRFAGWSPLETFDEERFYLDLVDKIEKHLGKKAPTILYHYPAELAMLAKTTRDDPPSARRFEVYVSGLELANAFEELNDPVEQRRRFERDVDIRRTRGLPAYPIDDVFIEALKDLPPCSGIAVGVDRLVMLFAGAESIGEVIAFPDEKV